MLRARGDACLEQQQSGVGAHDGDRSLLMHTQQLKGGQKGSTSDIIRYGKSGYMVRARCLLAGEHEGMVNLFQLSAAIKRAATIGTGSFFRFSQ